MITDRKTLKRVAFRLAFGKRIADVLRVPMTVPSDTVLSDTDTGKAAIYAIRHSVAKLRRSEAKGSQRRSDLRGLSVILLDAERMLLGAQPKLPDSHVSPVRPSSADTVVPTVPSDSIAGAFGDSDDADYSDED